MAETMHWVLAEQAAVDPDKHYLVKSNGGEWRDFDLAVMGGMLVEYRLRPQYVRGRPVWIAEITDPFTSPTESQP